MSKHLFTTLIGVILFFYATTFVYSQSVGKKGTLEVSPAFVEVVIDKPDQTKQVVLSYTNHSRKPITLDIFPIDFKQADGTGSISFLGAESGSFSYSLSSFLSFESNILEIGPGEKKDFAVSIRNRQDLSPGGHYAAVIARLQSPLQSDGGHAKVSPSISTFILLRKVGGERFNLSLSDLDWPQAGITFSYPKSIMATFQNEGNTHLVPYGRVEIKDIFGRLIYKGVINTSSLRIFPETRRYINIDMDQITWSMPISFNSIIVEGKDSLQKVRYSYEGSSLYVNPLFLTALITAGGIAIYIKWRKKK